MLAIYEQCEVLVYLLDEEYKQIEKMRLVSLVFGGAAWLSDTAVDLKWYILLLLWEGIHIDAVINKKDIYLSIILIFGGVI